MCSQGGSVSPWVLSGCQPTSRWASPSVRTPFIVLQNSKKSTQLHLKHTTHSCMCVCVCVCTLTWNFCVWQLPGNHNCSSDAGCKGGVYKRMGNGKSWQPDSVWAPQPSLAKRLSAGGLSLIRTSFLPPKCGGEGEGGLTLETLFAERVVACGSCCTHTQLTLATRTSPRFAKVNV